jgi:lactate dehydrogenase-like 2-hydroxyacid dehydrogenase
VFKKLAGFFYPNLRYREICLSKNLCEPWKKLCYDFFIYIYIFIWINNKGTPIYISAGSNLKVVATMAVGYDNIEVQEAKSRDIKVGNTPGVLDNAVAEIAICLLLEIARRIPEGRNCILKYALNTSQKSLYLFLKIYLF